MGEHDLQPGPSPVAGPGRSQSQTLAGPTLAGSGTARTAPRRLTIGNRSNASILRQEADAGPPPPDAGPGPDAGSSAVDIPAEGATLAVVTGPDGQQIAAAVAPTQEEAESWASKLINPKAAIYSLAGFVPGALVGGSFFLNDETRKADTAMAAAQARGAGPAEMDQLQAERGRIVPRVARRAGVIAIGDLGDNYGRMVVIDPDQTFVDGNKTLDMLARLGLNVAWTVAYAKIYNAAVSKGLGKGPANADGEDWTVPNKMIGIRIAIGPTIMWLGSMVDRLGLPEDDPRVPLLRAATVGGGVSGVLVFDDLRVTGAGLRTAERAAALGVGEAGERLAAGGLRGWLTRFAQTLGETVDDILRIPSDLVRGFKTQITQTGELIKKIGELGVREGIKQGRIPGMLKVGPLTFLLPTAQAYISNALGPPPESKEAAADAEMSVLARNLWFQFAEPGLLALGTGPVGAAAAALHMFSLGLEDYDKKGDAIKLAIEHGRRLSERVDQVAEACRHGGLAGDPDAGRYADQLRQGLAEGGFTGERLDQLVTACQPGGAGAEDARRAILEQLVDSLVTRYFTIHNAELGTSDLAAYRTYLRIAVGLPATEREPALIP